jgi:hypothetical protein
MVEMAMNIIPNSHHGSGLITIAKNGAKNNQAVTIIKF